MMLERLHTKQVEEILHTYGVKVAYLFGSYAKDTALPVSDVDIAVLFGKEIDRNFYFELSINLAADLIKTLERNDVDVVVLNTAPPLLRYKVFSEGIAVFADPEKNRIEFEVKAMRDYFDTKKLRDILLKAYLKRSA